MINKYIYDYVDAIHEKYPYLTKQEVHRIVRYLFFTIWQLNNRGGDVCIFTNKKYSQLFYIGYMTFNPTKRKEYWIRKMRIKIRILYKRKKENWDGYYYFALHDVHLAQLLNQKNKRGRPRQYYTFENIALYRIYEECVLMEQNKPNIFRVPYNCKSLFNFEEEFTCKDFEYIYRRVEGGVMPINHTVDYSNNLFNSNYAFLYWKVLNK